jgi:uncharacterized protein
MHQDKLFANRHPYFFTLLLIAVIVAVYVLNTVINFAFNLPKLVLYLSSNIILAAIAIVLLTRMGWWQKVGFKLPYKWRHLWFFIVPLILAVENSLAGINATAIADILLFFCLALLVGFTEEVLIRGLMLRSLASLGVWRAVIITSLIFGLLHSLNIVAGNDPQAVLMQMAYATAIGFTFAALQVRTGIIWPLILVHFLTDFSAFLALNGVTQGSRTSSPGLLIVAIYLIVFVGYGIWLLSKKDQRLFLSN